MSEPYATLSHDDTATIAEPALSPAVAKISQALQRDSKKAVSQWRQLIESLADGEHVPRGLLNAVADAAGFEGDAENLARHDLTDLRDWRAGRAAEKRDSLAKFVEAHGTRAEIHAERESHLLQAKELKRLLAMHDGIQLIDHTRFRSDAIERANRRLFDRPPQE